MTPTHIYEYEIRRDAALQIAAAALDQANAAAQDDPISGHQFRLILETARRIAARCGQRATDLAAADRGVS